MYCRSGSNETKSKDVKPKRHREKSGDRGHGRGRNRGPDIIQALTIYFLLAFFFLFCRFSYWNIWSKYLFGNST
jgi:zona occludens toxin (predicted ATPase)